MTALGKHLAALPPEEFGARLLSLDDEARAEALVERFRYDVPSMVRWLWPEEYGRPYAAPHLEVLGRPKVGYLRRRGSQKKTLRALAAPRGFSKTGTTIADLCHDALYGLEAVVVILSAELTLSRNSLRTIRALLSSDQVRELYGEVKIRGVADRFTVYMPSGSRCTFIAKSFGTAVRGLKDGTIRPTRVVVDDGEDKLKVNNPEQRKKWRAFLTEDILKVGDQADGLIVDWLGTVLHPDSVLAQLLKAPGWSSRRYAALITRPTREDLWAEAGRVWAQLDCVGPWFDASREWHDGPEGPVAQDVTFDQLEPSDQRHWAAWCFYQAHRAEMDAGAEMLSAAWLSLFTWYETVWAEGMASVLKELQNDPRNSDDALIDMERVRRCRFDGKTIFTSRGTQVALSDCTVGIWLDPSSGEEGKDRPAISVVARDRHGWRYWLEANGTRKRPSEQHAALWATWEAWLARGIKPLVGVDITGTQGNLDESFDRQREERRKRGVVWTMPLTKHTFSDNKLARLSSLEPPIHNGWIEVADTLPQDALDELRDLPNGTHDDYLDAMERADWLASGAGTPTLTATRTLRG